MLKISKSMTMLIKLMKSVSEQFNQAAFFVGMSKLFEYN